MMIAVYARKPYENSSFPITPALSANGSVFWKHPEVARSEMDGTSDPVSLISDPPKKFPNPTPKVVIVRPVTFWFALRLTVRKQ